MKIFQVITASEYGGAQTIVADLIKTFSKEHQVFVLYGGEGEAWSQLGNNFTRIRLNKHRKGISPADFITLLKLFYYRFKYRPDIVHLHSSKMGALGRIAFRKSTIVYTMHGFDSVRKAFPKFMFIEKALGSRVARFIGICKYDIQCMQEAGINNSIKLVYNGVVDNADKIPTDNDAMAMKLDAIKGKHSKIVMCIARISQQKRFDLFVDIARAKPEYAFVWIGNKEEMGGLPENTYCLGEAPAAYIYLKYANVFILPTNYEGLPMSLLEAISFGKPVVASNVCGIPEIVDGNNGFVVDNTVEDFANKIDYILSDEEREAKIGEAARKTYLEKFTIKRMTDSYKSVFEEVEKQNKL